MDDPKHPRPDNALPTLRPLASEFYPEAVDEERELLKNADVRALVVLLFAKLDRVVMQFAAQVAARDEARDEAARKRDLELTEALTELVGKVDGSMQGLNHLTTKVQEIVQHQELQDERLDKVETRQDALESATIRDRDAK